MEINVWMVLYKGKPYEEYLIKVTPFQNSFKDTRAQIEISYCHGTSLKMLRISSHSSFVL